MCIPMDVEVLDKRYVNIVGHQGLARFVNNLPCFKRAIEMYVQHDHQGELVNKTMTIIPSINFMPWDLFGFIDNTINKILTPFSGPQGNYECAVCKAGYEDAQQVFYSGYVKDHRIKVETIFCQMVSQLFLDTCLLDKLTRACSQRAI
jgi:hypothetical protein